MTDSSMNSNVPTIEVCIEGAAARHDALTALLEARGAHGFQTDAVFRAYVAAPDWSEADTQAVQDWLDAHAPEATLCINTIAARNWNAEWEASVEPQHIGPFFVRPSWSDAAPPPNAYPPLVIDPKMSFGTGYHPSTRLVLELLTQVLLTDAHVLDVGTGTGILAIAACRAGAECVDACDVDAGTIENAEENIKQNGVVNCVTVHHGTIQAVPERPVDVILANIHRSVLIDLMPEFAARVRPGGACICSGCLPDDAPAMREAARAHGFAVTNERTHAPWWAVHLTRAAA